MVRNNVEFYEDRLSLLSLMLSSFHLHVRFYSASNRLIPISVLIFDKSPIFSLE